MNKIKIDELLMSKENGVVIYVALNGFFSKHKFLCFRIIFEEFKPLEFEIDII